jgi:hypothetical protein
LRSFQFFFLSSFFWCEGSQEVRWSVCLSFYELWRFFVLVFWIFWSFQFSSYHFWGLQLFVWSFTRGKGCKQVNMSPTHLFNGLLLGEYSHKSPQKEILNLEFFLYTIMSRFM